jgi:hypothetical protein
MSDFFSHSEWDSLDLLENILDMPVISNDIGLKSAEMDPLLSDSGKAETDDSSNEATSPSIYHIGSFPATSTDKDFDDFFNSLPSPAPEQLQAYQQIQSAETEPKKPEKFSPAAKAPQRELKPEKKVISLSLTQQQRDKILSSYAPQRGARHWATSPPTAVSRPQRPPSVASSIASSKTTTKQAEYARMYRQKNKDYINTLEHKIDVLSQTNRDLKEETESQGETIIDLREEISYLRSVLANDSALAPLIQGAQQNVPGQKLTFRAAENPPSSDTNSTKVTTRAGGKRPAPSPNGTQSPTKRTRAATTNSSGTQSSSPQQPTPGVCLHVRNGEVSVEFCGRCNRQSSRCVPELQ